MATNNETLKPCIDCGEPTAKEKLTDGLCDECWSLSLELIDGLDLEDALELALDMAFEKE